MTKPGTVSAVVSSETVVSAEQEDVVSSPVSKGISVLWQAVKHKTAANAARISTVLSFIVSPLSFVLG